MDWITEKIAIGNYVDAADVPALEHAGFRSILCLDCTIAKPMQLKIPRYIVHLQDDPDMQVESFLTAVQTLEKLVLESSPVLVHCHAGRSRSVVVVAAFLMRSKGCSPEEAVSQVKSKREISITPGVERLLRFV